MTDNVMSAAATIRSLDVAGVDFSVPEAVLIDFLNNPEFTPYPAMAKTLLRLLDGHRLRRPVFIDVIVFNYENTPGVESPRKVEDVDLGVLKNAIVEGFNNRYAETVSDFQVLLAPLDIPPVPMALESLVIEGMSKTQNGVIFVDTDNPLIESSIKLMTVHADWAQGMVPQELQRQQLKWQFNNGDAAFSASDGEADAQDRPTRGGSLNDNALAWPKLEGTSSGATGAEVSLVGRIRVGYRPLTVKLLVSGPKAFAANTGAPFRVALDPDVLLVPVEVVRFFSSNVPVSVISAQNQMALWDQVPIVGATANTKSIDGSTGELKLAARAWDVWPTPSPPEGLYEHQGWVSPDSIWGKAKVRFRLVNYIDIPTDNEHAAPTGGVADDSRLRENRITLTQHPQHISDKRVVSVIFMHRIAPPDAPEVGRALIGDDTVGIAAGAGDRFATIAHEIGHLMSGSQGHSSLPNNIMNALGPGTGVTAGQIERARDWARGFADFWQHA